MRFNALYQFILTIALFVASSSYAISLADIAKSLEAAKPSVLSTAAVPRGDATQLNNWQQAFGDWDTEQTKFQNCLNNLQQCSGDLWSWYFMMHKIEHKPGVEKIAAVQTFFNAWAYKPDAIENWSSPSKSFKTRTGDCEDIAIAKYFTLSLLGFKESDMKIVAARDKVNGKMHALLAVNNTLLDNSGKPMQHTTRYQPRYSFNRFEKWLHI